MNNRPDETQHYPDCESGHSDEWIGSPNPANPDNEWICDECGAVIIGLRPLSGKERLAAEAARDTANAIAQGRMIGGLLDSIFGLPGRKE